MIGNCKPVGHSQAESKQKNGCQETQIQAGHCENILADSRLLSFFCDQRCHEDLDNGRLEIQATVLCRGVSIPKRQVVFASLQCVVYLVVCGQ